MSARLAAVLDIAHTDPAGQIFGPEAYVFGDTVARRVKAVKRAVSPACSSGPRPQRARVAAVMT